jgi:GT2 family glycosyltransferase
MALAEVGVVVVNYRAADDVERCLASLWPDIERGLRVVVVDNDSGDGSAARLRTWLGERPGVAERVGVLEAGSNLGFGAGNNAGVAWFADREPPRFVWFLNADCEVEPGAADALLAAGERDPEAVWGALIVERDAPDVVQSAAGYRYQPCLTRMQPLLAGASRAAVQRDRPALEGLDYIAGSSLFCSRAMFDRVGGFWPELFLYFEEVDLCRRIEAGGGRLAGELDAVVRHAGGTSTGGKASGRQRSSPVAEYHTNLSALLFTWRHHRRCFVIAAPVRLVFKAAQLVRTGQPALLRSVLAAYWAFARRVLVRR